MKALGFHRTAPSDTETHEPGAVFAAALRNYHICGTAYPIHHQKTLRPYRIADDAVAAQLPRAWRGISALGLYVHVPFCEARCAYCEYVVLPGRASGEFDAYLDLLAREFALYQECIGLRGRELVGFDVGGGTPMLLDGPQMARVIALAERHLGLTGAVTVSTETTPRLADAHPERLRDYRALGIRRLSMGVQTASPALLAEVSRPDDPRLHARAMAHIRAAGFTQVNLDLMYGFEGQSEACWEATLRHAVALDPEYVTLYRLRLKGTRLVSQASRTGLDKVVRLASIADGFLHAAGYQAPCGKNTYSRVRGDGGVSDYLTARVVAGLPYLGLGLGAQSWTATTLAYNQGARDKRLRSYAECLSAGRPPVQDLYHLSAPAAWAKMIAVSSYFGAIDRAAFQARFGLAIEKAFPRQTEWLQARGYLEPSGNALRLTAAGMSVLPGVIAQFYQPTVQRYLIETDWNAAIASRRGAGDRGRAAGRVPRRPAEHDGSGTCQHEACYDFASILFSGPCNQRCRWCLGRSLPPGRNGNTIDAWPLPGLDRLIERINAYRIRNVILTGTNTDPQLYRHEARLIGELRARLHAGASLQLHTNGMLALSKMDLINRYDRVCVSFPSFETETYAAITGGARPPALAEIVRRARVPIKVSCVVDQGNAPEIGDFMARCRAAGVKRLVLRKLYGTREDLVDLNGLLRIGEFAGNPIYDRGGMTVAYWDFGRASLRSLNLFADGTIGGKYLLAS
jgi:oxygen-independent coproporphyrinogen-3 oxidase